MGIVIDDISKVYAVITGFASATVFIYQHIKHKKEQFKQYAKDLYREDNETAQITSAILLRSYLDSRAILLRNPYTKKTLNLIAAILRHIPNGNLQKTLADSISYVHKANGQDFQNVNLNMCSIKPKSRINYELSGKPKFLRKYISLRCADFFNAKILYSGLYNINAEKGVFCYSLLCNTTFHNCILNNADFRYADVCNLQFKDCNLVGAKFGNAIQLDKAKVYNKENGIEGLPLLDFLDKDGVFIGLQKSRKYSINTAPLRIFISKLGHMNTKQKIYYENLKEYLRTTFKYQFEFIDPEEYCEVGQIDMITDRMSKCSGILILAFSYVHIDNGNMVVAKSSICNEEHISPWLHIEATIANSLYKLPCMVITEDNVFCNGIFDKRVMQNDSLMYSINYNGSLTESDEEQLRNWSRKVKLYSMHKKHDSKHQS